MPILQPTKTGQASSLLHSLSQTGYTNDANPLRRVANPMNATQANTSPFAAVLAEHRSASEGAKNTTNYDPTRLLSNNDTNSRDVATRANIIAQVDMDKQRMQALEQLGQNMKSSDSLLDVARNDVAMRNMRAAIGGFNLRAPVMPMENSIKANALMQAQRNMRLDTRVKSQEEVDTAISTPKVVAEKAEEGFELGKLSSKFESGSAGIAAIGYDRVGGTSYGKYQIASRVGSMDRFLDFLDGAAPDMAEKLRAAGPSNTGGRKGEMPEVWRDLAEEEPVRFEALQDKFIYESHYKPALAAISEQTSLKEDKISSVMEEVLWSTAVQHGPSGAARIFSRAAARSGDLEDKNFDQRIINNIYAIRSEQFGSSTEAVQRAVRNRMVEEKNLALDMLRKDSLA